MKIEFENGSSIESIDTATDNIRSKRGEEYIKYLKETLEDTTITETEGYYDIFVKDEDTGEIKTEKRWCTKVDIKPDNPVVLVIKDGGKNK